MQPTPHRATAIRRAATLCWLHNGARKEGVVRFFGPQPPHQLACEQRLPRHVPGGGIVTGRDLRNIGLTDDELIQNFYLAVLSRFPTLDEKDTAKKQLQSGNRVQQAEDLLWSLFNKVDFIYNY